MLANSLAPSQRDRILSIASGGDNSLLLSAYNPKEIVAFDLNPVQLYLSELKYKAVKHLSREETLHLLSLHEKPMVYESFLKLKPYLSIPTMTYFENNSKLLLAGILDSGKFEKYFYYFRKFVLPLIHSKRKIDELFRTKSASEQKEFYDKHWNTSRWRSLFKLFFSKFVMGRLGRDPSFFEHVDGSVGDKIYKRAESELSSISVFENYYLDYQLRGKFSIDLPLYLREDIFQKIKESDTKMVFHLGDLSSLEHQKKFNLMNLSNIFEYMSEDVFRQNAKWIGGLAALGARIAYFNLLVDRDLSKMNERFSSVETEDRNLCFFYNKFRLTKFE